MTEKAKQRHPAVAALLSLVLMGLGQLYNGQLRRAVVFFTLEILGFVAVVTISTFLSVLGIVTLYIVLLIYAGIRIFAVIDAFIGARRIGVVKLQRYNRWYVYLSIFLVMMIIPVVFQNPLAAYSIPSRSMLPTLLVGDHVLVDKNAYHDRAPERGDVVVFKLPRANYIYRIIGLPGDRIQVIRGRLHINGKMVARTPLGQYIDIMRDGYKVRYKRYRETLPNGVSYAVLERGDDTPFVDNTDVYVVPKGHYFMMGDNRDNSQDSRYLSRVGFVPAENLVGRADFRKVKSWWQFWYWPRELHPLRPDR